REAFPLDLDPYEVLGGGALAIARERIEDWCATVLDVKYRSHKSNLLRPESFKLGADVRDVYNHLDGTRTVGELAMRYTDELKRDRFLRVLYLLVMTELARPADGGG